MAIEQAPAFQFYVKEWRSSRAVQRMTFAQRGMYLEMLLEQWENLSLPDDPIKVAHLIGGTDQEWIDAWPVLRRKFVDRRVKGRPGSKPIESRIINIRLERVRKQRKGFVNKARLGGIKRALSGSRRKDGTYSPASEPAALQPPSSTPTASATATASASASATDSLSARARPLHDTGHRHHAACGRVCLPGALFAEFVRRRNHAGAESEIDAWATAVLEDWREDGPKARLEPGDAFPFWRARYEERWPATRGDAVSAPGSRTSGNLEAVRRFTERKVTHD